MTLEEIHNLWNKDGEIDMTNITREAARIPFLHNKYYMMYAKEHLKLVKLEAEYKKLINLKDDYYRGILDKDELDKLGWQPCLIKIRVAEIPKYIDADNDVIDKSLKIGLQKEICNFLKSIVDMINNRSFQLKLIVEHKKFENGGY